MLAWLSHAISTPTPSSAPPHTPPNSAPCAPPAALIFILITLVLFYKMRSASYDQCSSQPFVCGPLSARPVFLGEDKGREAGVGGKGKPLLPSLIFVYRQQMTEKVLLTLFSGARRWASGRARQRNGGMMKSWAVQGRCFHRLLGAAERTCPLLTHRDGSMRHQLTQHMKSSTWD